MNLIFKREHRSRFYRSILFSFVHHFSILLNFWNFLSNFNFCQFSIFCPIFVQHFSIFHFLSNFCPVQFSRFFTFLSNFQFLISNFIQFSIFVLFQCSRFSNFCPIFNFVQFFNVDNIVSRDRLKFSILFFFREYEK